MKSSKASPKTHRGRPQRHRSGPRPKPLPAATALPGTLHARFTPKQLLGRFRKLLPPGLLAAWLVGTGQNFYQRAFTPLITLWYFIFQRLGADHTLAKALSDAWAGGADGLSPKGKRLSAQLRSAATTSLSDARQRLPLPLFQQALQYSAHQIRSWARGLQWRGWNVVLLDGSTVRLRPYQDIPEKFPPHRPGNCKKAYWCLMRVVVGFCLASGVVMDCTIGPAKRSEQALAAALFAGSTWVKSLFVGDRNFGVYSVVRSAVAASAQVLVRLTEVRAKKLARCAKVPLRAGLDVLLSWKPSAQDQCPPGLAAEPVAGRLLAIGVQRPGFRSQVLYLFTTLTDAQAYCAADLADLYGQRWQVELNLRFVKTQMDLGALECKSADMAQKEWLAGLIAYNLIRSVMVAAAAHAHLPVLVLSFSRTRQFFQDWLVRWAWRPTANSQAWEQLLDRVARCRHPRRRKPRPPEPRAIRYCKQDFPKLIGDRAQARKNIKSVNAKN